MVSLLFQMWATSLNRRAGAVTITTNKEATLHKRVSFTLITDTTPDPCSARLRSELLVVLYKQQLTTAERHIKATLVYVL